MSIEQRLAKLDGHAAALLDSYRGLRQTFALLEPLLPDGTVSRALNSGPAFEGLAGLRQALFLGCALDVAKLCLDTDTRTPSVANLVQALEASEVVEALRSRSAQYCLPRQAGDEVDEASLRQHEARERQTRAEAFDERLARLRTASAGLQKELSSLAKIRDKYIAHLELRCVDGAYAPIDLAGLGLKWSDLSGAIAAMEPLVADISAIVRCASFDMDGAVRHFVNVRDAFWARAR